MRRTALIGFLLALAASAETPTERRWQSYFEVAIRSKWAKEKLSENRVITVRGLVKYDCVPAAAWLMRTAIDDEAADVVREAVRVLGKFKAPATVKEMARIWEKQYKKKIEAKTLTLGAFAKRKTDSAERVLGLALTKEKDARVIAAACRAVGVGRHLKFKDQVIKLLRHRERAVRGAAALALGEYRDDTVMPVLFKMFVADKSHRVRYDAWLALKKVSLQKHAFAPDAWEKWWNEQAAAVPEGETNPWGMSFPRVVKDALKKSYFFGIPVAGDRIVFVLHCSLDMNDPWEIDYATERKKKKEDRIPGFFSVKTRWDLQRNYVLDCIKDLPGTTAVAFSFYRHEIDVYPTTGKFLKLTKKARKGIVAMFDEVKRSGATAMYEGLKAGWGFLKAGHADTNFKKGVDTLIFCTSGQPSKGELANRADRLRDEVWRVSNGRHVRVHTVGLHNHAFELLKAIAKDSDGLYVHVQQKGDPAEPQDLDFWPEKKKAFEAARKKKKKKRG